jgi:hypothetical protein
MRTYGNAMSSKLSLATQTMFAELRDRCLDAQFDADFDERGTFIKKRIKRDDFWYYQRWTDGKPAQIYVGPARDAEITRRVETFKDRIKPDFSQRREMVRALAAAGLPQSDPMTGAVVEGLWKAGFFRLRGILIGTTAFQCYAGLLRTKISGRSLRTADADLAQYLAISREVNDQMPPMESVLTAIDPSFQPIMDSVDGRHVIAFVNRDRYRVEFLTPRRGAGHREGKPIRMPALGGVSAISLSYLDYLLQHPVRSAMLYGAGVPVAVPAPERYAVHKLIVAMQRSQDSRAKRAKDVDQAGELILALTSENFHVELIDAWVEAWDRGPKWRQALKMGRTALDGRADRELTLAAQIANSYRENNSDFAPLDLQAYGLGDPS